jgi:hypothetical protein
MSKSESPYVSPPHVDANGSSRTPLLVASGLAWIFVSVGSFFLQSWIMPLHAAYEPESLDISGYVFPFSLPIMSSIIGIGFNFAIAKTRRESSRVTLYAMSLLFTAIAFSVLTVPLVLVMYRLA